MVVEPGRGPHCGADPRPPIMRSARRGGTYPVLLGARADGGEMGAAGVTGVEWEALEGADWESLVKHVPGTRE